MGSRVKWLGAAYRGQKKSGSRRMQQDPPASLSLVNRECRTLFGRDSHYQLRRIPLAWVLMALPAQMGFVVRNASRISVRMGS